jgi:hypothetical protein
MSQLTIEPRQSVTSPALEKSRVIKASPGRVFGCAVQLGDGTGGSDTMPTGTYWLLLVDAAAVPGAGTVAPFGALQVDHAQGTRDLVSFGDEVGGIEAHVGCVLLLSTGANATTYAIPSGNWMQLVGGSFT